MTRGYTYAEGRAALAEPKFAWGEPDWQQHPGFIQAQWLLECEHFPPPALGLYVKFSGERVDRPSIVLRFNEVCLLRLDVNGVHGQVVGTHWQGVPSTDVRQWTEMAEDVVPNFPTAPPVEGHWFQEVFRAHAERANIDVDGVQWIDPPLRGVA